MTERLREREPAPHVTEQADHAVKSDVVQCTAHGLGLGHAWVSALCMHTTPPHDGWVVTPRVRVRVPAPHVVEHDPQTSHAASKQSTGQQPVLHAWVSADAPQATPPCSGWARLRSRVETPPSHVFVQTPYSPQRPGKQSFGHGVTLHSRVSSR